MNGKVKILYVHHGVGIGGAPISLLNLIKKLPKEKFEVLVVFQRYSLVVDLYKEAGVRVHVVGGYGKYLIHHKKDFIPWYRFYKYLPIAKDWIANAYYVAPKILSDFKPDIVHLNSDVLSSWAVAAKREGALVVCHNRDPFENHGYFGFRTKFVRSLLEKSVDRFICISEDNRDRLGIPSKSSVIYNTVDIPVEYREPFSGDGRSRVLFVGGMARVKGFRVLSQAIEYVNPDIDVIILGKVDRVKNAKSGKEFVISLVKRVVRFKDYKYLSHLDRFENVYILGLRNSILEELDRSDILISPFVVEHFSRPIIEAFAYGKPVIATNIPGMSEIVKDNKDGILVDAQHPAKLAEAINWLVRNPSVGVQMGKCGRLKAERLFNSDKNVLGVIDVYSRLLYRDKKCS